MQTNALNVIGCVGSALAALALAGFVGIAARPAVAQAPEPIKLGALVAMTGSDALNGFNHIVGIRMAVDEINKAGGIGGRTVSLVVADDQSDPTATVNETRRLVFQEKVHALLGPGSSQRTVASIPIQNEAKVASVSFSGSNQLTPQFAPYHFSTLASAEAQGISIARHVSETLKAKSVAILIDNGAQAKAGLADIKAALDKANVKITGEQEFAFRSEDKTPQLLSLKRGNPDALILWANTPEDYGTVLNNLEQIGWDRIRISGALSQSMLAAPASKVAAPDLFSQVGAVVYTGWTYCSNEDPAKTTYGEFLARLKAYEPRRYKDLAVTNVSGMYDAVYLLKAAIEATKSTDGPAIAAWIEGNAQAVRVVSGRFSASRESHFLVGSSGLASVVDPLKVSPEGLWPRAGC